jgi:hypothetical protein
MATIFQYLPFLRPQQRHHFIAAIWVGLNGWWRQVFGFSLQGKRGVLRRGGSRKAGWDPADAARYVSERSYQCLAAPSETDKAMKPADPIQNAPTNPLAKVPRRQNLSDMTSSVQPVNELVRPVEQGNSNAFAIMAVPDQMADSFLCQSRHLPEKTPALKPSDAKYGSYYLSANRLNYGEEESPALLLLWTREKDQWKVVAWAVEVP